MAGPAIATCEMARAFEPAQYLPGADYGAYDIRARQLTTHSVVLGFALALDTGECSWGPPARGLSWITDVLVYRCPMARIELNSSLFGIVIRRCALPRALSHVSPSCSSMGVSCITIG